MEATAVAHVACAAEGDYIPHSAAMLHSVLAHADSSQPCIHYLHGPGLDKQARGLLTGMVESQGGSIDFLPIQPAAVAGLPASGYFTSAMWYRIFLPDLLPHVDRLLYLDVDTIAVDSLADLWDLDIRDHYLAAVTNVLEPQFAHRPESLGLPSPDAYFNTGVMLMNLSRMRHDGCTEALRTYAVEHAPGLLWPDQDAFNVVLGGRRMPLHPRWNCMNSIMHMPESVTVFGTDAVAEAQRNPAIRHFEGPSINKPWHYLCERSLRELYFSHRRQTPWPKCRLEGATFTNRGRRLVHALRRRFPGGFSGAPAR